MKRRVAIVAISADEHVESVNFAREGRIGFPLLRDSDLRVATAYGVAMVGDDIAIPSTFVIDTDGTIAWKKVGETQFDRADVDEVFRVVDGLLATPAK